MAFGKKKVQGETFDQKSVYTLASKALADRRSLCVRIAFRATLTSPLLMNRWTGKAVVQMLGKMVGKEVLKEFKDLTVDYENSYYRNTEGAPIVPCRVIKAAIVEGAIMTGNYVTKASLKRELRVLGNSAVVKPPKGVPAHSMDLKMVRVGNDKPDVRARAAYPIGTTFDFVVQFPSGGELSPDKVIAALEGAGTGIGIGEWRPQNGGEYGSFTIDLLAEKEIERILDQAASPEEEFQIPPEFLRALKLVPDDKIPDPIRKATAVVAHVNGQNGHASSIPSRRARKAAEA